MRVGDVRINNRRKAFEISTERGPFLFPYAILEIPPSNNDPIVEAFVDSEIGGEGFTYRLKSGLEDTIHVDKVLEYNRDPGYMRDALLYSLTLEAQARVKSSGLSKREIIRRLGTSAAQFYRLLDQTNYSKSVDQLLRLFSVLDCEVEFTVKAS